MDRALKERIIGAVVLVIFAVLLVPVFLDGDSRGVVQTEQPVLLPGQDPVAQKTVVLERDRDEPVPVARSQRRQVEEQVVEEPDEEQPESTPPATPAPQPTPDATGESTEAEASSPPSSTGMWAVQLGSFSNKNNAEGLAAELRQAGFAAFLSQTRSGAQSLHRVRIGPQKDRAAAEAVAKELQEAGHTGQVVPHL